jgi:hypothetical protein
MVLDPFGGSDAIRGSVGGLKAAQRWVEAGGCLAVFPAGEVSHFQLGQGAILDPAWSPSVVRLARRAGASMLPVHFAGANGALFQLAGLVHPRLRTALLPRELLRRQATSLSVRVGRVVSAARIASMDDDAGTALLRSRTYVLARDPRPHRPAMPSRPSDRPRRFMRAVAGPVADHRLDAEVAALPGPTRKRTPSPYCFRLVYRNADPDAVGCALQWDVLGGREATLPLATPGVMRDALRMLLDPAAPLRIPLSYLPKAAPWLTQWAQSAVEARR